MKATIILAAVVLSGCAAGQWAHSTKTQADFGADSYECEQQAYGYADSLGATGNPFIAAGRFRECMGVRGYQWVQQ